ncbi:unnamed protein product [Rotaria sordida]|uniref:Uncharacterized protein n=1 Tax=Rotaria sordida TaxID=392033 RepID=A0A815SG55_9BILA|nr:unnamed protein product [Rotaria sordida]CAF1489714.1 unnamed protein product [Rotaria sordida]
MCTFINNCNNDNVFYSLSLRRQLDVEATALPQGKSETSRKDSKQVQEKRKSLRLTNKTEHHMENLRVEMTHAGREKNLALANVIMYGAFSHDENEITETEHQITEENKQQQARLSNNIIEPNIIHEIASELFQTQHHRLLKLNENLRKKVVGQDDAIDSITKVVLRRKGEFSRQNQPIGSFLFLGTHGVGKTELAKTLALELFDSTESIICIDMSKYTESNSIARLLSVPSIKRSFSIARLIDESSVDLLEHVGFEQGGELTEAIRRQPYAVILFNKIEKAHPQIWNTLLQILDNGRLKDRKGQTVDFTNTIFVLTSNIGAQYILDEVENQSSSIKISNGELSQTVRLCFRSEFFNRLDDIVFFQPLNINQLSSIVNLQLKSLECLKEKDIEINLTDEAIQSILKKSYNPVYGVDPLKRYVEEHLKEELFKLLIQTRFPSPSLVIIDTGINNQYLFRIQHLQRTTSNSTKKPGYVR